MLVLESQLTGNNRWPVGSVAEDLAGQGRLMCSANVKIRDGDVLLPIHKLCMLEKATHPRY